VTERVTIPRGPGKVISIRWDASACQRHPGQQPLSFKLSDFTFIEQNFTVVARSLGVTIRESSADNFGDHAGRIGVRRNRSAASIVTSKSSATPPERGAHIGLRQALGQCKPSLLEFRLAKL
jgi:hypothetical protein